METSISSKEIAQEFSYQFEDIEGTNKNRERLLNIGEKVYLAAFNCYKEGKYETRQKVMQDVIASEEKIIRDKALSKLLQHPDIKFFFSSCMVAGISMAENGNIDKLRSSVFKLKEKEIIHRPTKEKRDEQAMSYARSFIIFWEFSGIIYASISGKFSFWILLAVSILSLPFLIPIMAAMFWVKTKQVSLLSKFTINKTERAIINMFSIAWSIIEFFVPIVLAILFVRLLSNYLL